MTSQSTPFRDADLQPFVEQTTQDQPVRQERADERPQKEPTTESGPAPMAAEPGNESGATESRPAVMAAALGSPVAGRVVGSEVAPWDEAKAVNASPGGWQGLLELLGIGRQKKADLESQALEADYERVIRQRTWTRAVNVAVHSTKGSVGCTPFAIVLGGVLASIRGGEVTVLEGTVTPGDLQARAEGNPPRGLGELIGGTDLVTSSGNLAGYTAPQTSFAAVIGTVGHRDRLRADQVKRVRELVDTYAQVSVTDLGSDPTTESTQAGLELTDAVVVPAVVSVRAISHAVDTVHAIVRQRPDLRERVLVVLGHSGAPEDPDVAATAVPWLTKKLENLARVEQVPFDPMLQGDGEITIAQLSPASRLAWKRVAATVVQMILDHPRTDQSRSND
ncbi:hypothetical protein PZ938_00180 [Luteipulveratus sp. YIM 133132]|uniref:hypothetical protein n=1 Tax=Luteipulveratus flavus TaxID=3031728 RepID=UPI0023AE78FF|nr:hypothetical protein [Luteipulveratus sp. YIM 133132]MDE9364011.1 hypothetical protein [Luteipulveratus sp. YIM 133132]